MLFLMLSDEYRAIDQDHQKLLEDQTAAFALAKKTADDAHQTLAGVGALPKMISDKHNEIMAAERKHDPTEAAKLRADLKALEKQRLLELALELREEMRHASYVWSSADYMLQLNMRETRGTPEGLALYTQKRNELNVGQMQQNEPLLERADKARAGLLLLVPSQDKKLGDAIYAKAVAGQPIDWGEMQSAAEYLNSLYLAAIK